MNSNIIASIKSAVTLTRTNLKVGDKAEAAKGLAQNGWCATVSLAQLSDEDGTLGKAVTEACGGGKAKDNPILNSARAQGSTARKVLKRHPDRMAIREDWSQGNFAMFQFKTVWAEVNEKAEVSNIEAMVKAIRKAQADAESGELREILKALRSEASKLAKNLKPAKAA